MFVKDLQVRRGIDRIELEVLEKEDAREWSNYKGSGRVASGRAKDRNGDEVDLTLWNQDIDKVKAGDTIIIENGWCSEFQGKKQVSTGRLGRLTVKE